MGLNHNLPGWTRLEEARARLLLYTHTRGIHVGHELDKRTKLWEDGEYWELLSRVEFQIIKERNLQRQIGRRTRRIP